MFKTEPELYNHIFVTALRLASQKVAIKNFDFKYKLKTSFVGHNPDSINSFADSGNEDFASGANDKLIKIWSNFTLKSTLANHTGSITKLVYLGTDKLMSSDDVGYINIWNLNDDSLIYAFQAHSSSILDIFLTSNGDIISGSSDNSIKIWYSTNFTLKSNFKNISQLSSLALLSDGSLATGMNNGPIFIWDINNGALKANLTGHADKISTLVVLNNGNLASGSNDFSIKIWDTNSFKLKMTLIGHTSNVNCLCDLLNGYLASGSDDQRVKIWSLNSGLLKQSIKAASYPISALTFLSNGMLVSASSMGYIRIWYSIYYFLSPFL
jgi:WD40 repeat protein